MNLKRKIFSLGMATMMFLTGSACGGLFTNQKAYAVITESEKTQFEKLSKITGIESEKIINCLKFSCKDKDYSCELVIIDGSKEHKDCFMDIFVKEDDENADKAKAEYMRYYLNGKLREKDNVEGWFSRSVENINKSVKENLLPSSITLMIKVNDEIVGRIGLGPLVNGNPEIGYAIKKEFSSKGITENAVGAALNFLKLLLSSKKYNFEKLRATAKEENSASRRILSGRGFKEGNEKIDDGYGPECEYFYYFNK